MIRFVGNVPVGFIKPRTEEEVQGNAMSNGQRVGGNKRFFDFLRLYEKDHDAIEAKYKSDAA